MGSPLEQRDLFGVQKKRAEGALQSIEEKEEFGNYFDAARMCEEYGHTDRAFGNYKKSADQQRNNARAAYVASEKDPENNAAVFENLSDAARSYDTAALSCEGALRTLPKEMHTKEMLRKVRRGAFNMWRMKGDLQSKIMEQAYKTYIQKMDRLKKLPKEQQKTIQEKRVRELDSISQKCLQTSIAAFSNALEYCDDPEGEKKMKERLTQREQMLGASFERSIPSQAA